MMAKRAPSPSSAYRSGGAWLCLAAALGCTTGGGAGPRDDGVPSDDDFASRHTSWRRARVVVADADEARLSVVDVEDDEVVAVVPLDAPATIEATESGTFAVVRSASPRSDRDDSPPPGTASGRARLLYGGVAIVDHDDHIHIYKYPARLLPLALPSSRVHVRAGLLAAFEVQNDVAAKAALLLGREDDMTRGAEPARVPLPDGGAAHDGFVVPLSGAALLVSHATSPQKTASALELRTHEGALLGGRIPCEAPTAHAAVGPEHLVACREAFVFVSVREGTPVVRRFEAAAAPIDALVAAPGARHAFARSGAQVFAIDAETGAFDAPPASVADPSSAAVCDVEADAAHPDRAVLLLDDGTLRLWDRSLTQGVPEPLAVVSPFRCGDPVRPRLAVAPERAYLTDPARGVLHDIDLRGPRIARAFEVGGRPSSVAVVGVDPKNANVAPGASHDGF